MDALSRYLAEQIDSLDEALTAQELAEAVTDREALLESVEGFCRGTKHTIFQSYDFVRKLPFKTPTEVIKSHYDVAAYLLDDSMSRLMVSEIPKIVSRALQLEPILIEQRHQADDNAYLREATRCFLFGLFNACVALSRSSLERALSEKIPALLQGGSKEDGLQMLIQTARISIMKQTTELCDLADRVRIEGNAIIHEKICNESEALQVLRDTRKIVGYLYNRVPH